MLSSGDWFGWTTKHRSAKAAPQLRVELMQPEQQLFLYSELVAGFDLAGLHNV